MSLRPSLFGFELARLRAHLGSGDVDAAERVCAQLARHAKDAARLAESQEIARTAVMLGVPFVGLERETSAHVDAAIALGRLDQTLETYLALLLTDGIGLGDRTLRDLAFAAARRRGWPVPVAAARLGGFFARARRAALSANPRRVLGFVDELAGWLARLASSRRDLFYFAA